jgi:phosphatidylinositol-3-phosphatase
MRIGRLPVLVAVLTAGFGIAPAGPAALAADRMVAGPTAAGSPAAGSRATGATTASAVPLCGSMAGTRPHITKVMWIFMENRSYGNGPGQIPGDPSAKYIDGTLIKHCGSTSDYHGITHSSFPNYLAATSGGLHGDGSQHSYSVRSIFSQVDPSWRSYEEFMPVPCDHVPQIGNPATGQYYVNRHNPAAFYSSQPVSGDCTRFDRRLGHANTGALARAVSAGKLPRFSFVTPGLCDDMHLLPPGVAGCANSTASGDAWLATWIPIITAGRDYQKGRLVIDVTWDEGSGGKLGAHCLTSNAANCIVPDIVISPYTRHKVASRNLSHYSLLKMTERLLGLHFLGRARNTTVRDLCKPFGLCPRHRPPAQAKGPR